MPLVDAPIAALGSSFILPMDSESLPRDPTDKSVEPANQRAFQAPANALKSSAAASLTARALVLSCQQFADTYHPPPKILEDLRRLAAMAAFTADASGMHWDGCQGHGSRCDSQEVA